MNVVFSTFAKRRKSKSFIVIQWQKSQNNLLTLFPHRQLFFSLSSLPDKKIFIIYGLSSRMWPNLPPSQITVFSQQIFLRQKCHNNHNNNNIIMILKSSNGGRRRRAQKRKFSNFETLNSKLFSTSLERVKKKN